MTDKESVILSSNALMKGTVINMRIQINKNPNFDGEPEIIINCKDIDEHVHKILTLLEHPTKKLYGYDNQKEYILDPSDILYCESVDGIVFIYQKDSMYRSSYTLNELEAAFSKFGFFRCSKSMVMNINSIKSLKSELGNRIDAHLIISRHFAKQFRTILKEAGNL